MDDHDRQTDNDWLETVVYNFHDEENILYKFLLVVSTIHFLPSPILGWSFVLTLKLRPICLDSKALEVKWARKHLSRDSCIERRTKALKH